MAKTLLPAIVFGLLTTVAGVAHGLHAGRWHQSGSLEEAARALDRVPAEFGAWKGTDRTLDAESLSRAGIKGYIYRTYSNTRTGSEMSVLVVCGRPGPISVHTPDVCYEGAGYQPVGEQTRVTARDSDSGSSSFWSRRYRTPGTAATSMGDLEIYWGWSVGGNWSASDSPRWAYARHPALFKMYIVRALPPTARTEQGKPAVEFLEEALPVMNQALFADP